MIQDKFVMLNCYKHVIDRPDDENIRYECIAKLQSQHHKDFIFNQIEMVKKRANGDITWVKHAHAASQLEKKHSADWLETYGLWNKEHEWVHDSWRKVQKFYFHKGMVEELVIDARSFLDHAETFYSDAPIRHLTLTSLAGISAAEFFTECSYLERIVSLSLRKNALGDRGLVYLVASPYVAGLRWLDLSDNQISRKGIQRLAEASQQGGNLSSLQYLRFHANNVEDPCDDYSIDPRGRVVVEWQSTKFGDQLEIQYGTLQWLHAPRYFPFFPPRPGDF